MDKVALISFLGKQRRNEGGYRTTRYRFIDGEVVETRYFAKALRGKLAPDCIVLLGTSGSMWDVLIEDCDAGLLDEELRLALIDAVDRNAVDQSMLDQVAKAVASAWDCEVRLGLIPYGRNEAEQMAILHAMDEGAKGASAVHLDITHGFRILPMLLLMATFYLEVVRGLKIAGVHYGMFDARDADDVAPVVSMDGLLRFGHWIGALRQYDKDGDYSVFADLLEDAGVKNAKQIKEAAFYERIADVRRANGKISGIYRQLGMVNKAEFPAAAMFMPELQRRLDWFRKPSLAEKEWILAEEYLHRRDYFRAALLALEAAVSADIEARGGNIADYGTRKAAHNRLRNSIGEYKQLNRIRNQIAHGSREKNTNTKQAMRDEPSLSATLRDLIRILRNRNPG